MTIDELRDRVAKVLRWDRKGVDSFSLPALKAFVRGKDKELDGILARVIESGEHVLEEQ